MDNFHSPASTSEDLQAGAPAQLAAQLPHTCVSNQNLTKRFQQVTDTYCNDSQSIKNMLSAKNRSLSNCNSLRRFSVIKGDGFQGPKESLNAKGFVQVDLFQF